MTARGGNARSVAATAFVKLGCHPKALPELDAEASDAVVLLAVTFARLHEYSMFNNVTWGDWDDYFLAPSNRIDVAPFISWHWRLYEMFRPEYNAKLIEWDRVKLRTWLRYARERIKRIERRLVIIMLADTIMSKPTNIVGLCPQ